MNIDDLIDIDKLRENVNKADESYEKAFELAMECMQKNNSLNKAKAAEFLCHYRLSVLGRDKVGHLFLGDLYTSHIKDHHVFGIKDLKDFVNLVNDPELWYEFAQFIVSEKKDFKEKMKFSTKQCILESHAALEKAFLLAMPIARGLKNTPNKEKEIDQTVQVRNAIRNGLFSLQFFLKKGIGDGVKKQNSYLFSQRDRNLPEYFMSSINGLVKLVESAKLEDFLKAMILLWTDVRLNKHIPNLEKNTAGKKQFDAYFEVMNKARNWFVHKQIKKVEALDVGFLFITHARLLREGLTTGQGTDLMYYEEKLLEMYEISSNVDKRNVDYNYRSFSEKWNWLGDWYLTTPSQKKNGKPIKLNADENRKLLIVEKIYRYEPEKLTYDIFRKKYNNFVDNNDFLHVLYRSFFRPDVDCNKLPYLKEFYKIFYSRAEFEQDIVLQYFENQSEVNPK